MTAEATAEDITRQAIAAAPQAIAGFAGIEDVRLGMSRRGLDRARQDEILAAMYRRQEINLVPQSNQAALTWLRREVALTIGGEDKHLVSAR